MQQATEDILRLSLKMLAKSGRGHVGSTITAAILLGEHVAPEWRESDELILSKAHACAAEYAFHVVVSKRVTAEQITYPLYPWEGHSNRANGVSPFTLGSLGLGPAMALGLAIAYSMINDKHIWCIVGDAERYSGAVQEVVQFISDELGVMPNLTLLVDYNGAGAAQEFTWYRAVPKNIGLACSRVEAHYQRITEADIEPIIEAVKGAKIL